MPRLHVARAVLIGASAVALLPLAALPAQAGTGELDPAFGMNGVARSALAGEDYATSALQLIDGSYLELAQHVVADPQDDTRAIGTGVSLVKYSRSGQRDTSYGSAGAVRLPSQVTGAADLVRTGDGTLYAVGSTGRPADSQTGRPADPTDIALIRLTPAGEVDTSFGTAGVVTRDISGEDYPASAAAVGNSIVINGSNDSYSNFVARFNGDGTADRNFDRNGNVNFYGYDVGTAEVDSASRTVVTTPNYDSTDVRRFLPDGTPDTSFGTNGKRSLPLIATGFALLPDGRAIIPGTDSDQPVVHLLGTDGISTSIVRLPVDSVCAPRLLGARTDQVADRTVVTAWGDATTRECGQQPYLTRLVLQGDQLVPDTTFANRGVLNLDGDHVLTAAPADLLIAGDNLVLATAIEHQTAPDYDAGLVAIDTTGAAASTLDLNSTTAVTLANHAPVRIIATLSGNSAAGQRIALQRRKPGGIWTTVNAGTTASSGGVTLTDTATLPVAEYRAVFAGTPVLAASTSQSRTIEVANTLTATASASRVKFGSAVRITGKASPATRVVLQRKSGSGWVKVAETTPSSNGYTFTTKPPTATAHRYRVVKPAASGFAQVVSRELAVTAVRAAPAPAPAAAPQPVSQPASTSTYYANCSEARDAGAAPIYAGEPGYRSGLDRDGDGVACE